MEPSTKSKKQHQLYLITLYCTQPQVNAERTSAQQVAAAVYAATNALYYIRVYSSQYNCIIKAYVKGTCFALKRHCQAKLRA